MNGESEAFIPAVSPSVLASWGHHGRSSPRGDGTDPIVPIAFRQKAAAGAGLSAGPLAPSLEATAPQHAVAFAENSRAEIRLEGGDGQLTETLTGGGGKPGQGVPTIAQGLAVRRLTPRETERLQGFPDDWTRYAADGSEIADTHRYRMTGNAVTVPVAAWIARRITRSLA